MTTDTAIKSRSIIFTGQSVPQIMADLKRQTRRLVKPQPEQWIDKYTLSQDPEWWIPSGVFISDPAGCLGRGSLSIRQSAPPIPCPYTVGMLLWVKETIQKYDRTPPTAQYRADLTAVVGKYAPPISDLQLGCDLAGRAVWRWKRDTLSSLFMPRELSRLTLEVTAVGIERVQEISPPDIVAEGMATKHDGSYWGIFADGEQECAQQEAFGERWNSLHAKPKAVKERGKIVRYESFPWDADYKELEYRDLPWIIYGNPHVFKITFKRVEQEGGGR